MSFPKFKVGDRVRLKKPEEQPTKGRRTVSTTGIIVGKGCRMQWSASKNTRLQMVTILRDGVKFAETWWVGFWEMRDGERQPDVRTL